MTDRDLSAEIAGYLAQPGVYTGTAGSNGRSHDPIRNTLGRALINAGFTVSREFRLPGANARIDLAVIEDSAVTAVIEVKTSDAALGIGQLVRYATATKAETKVLACPSAHATDDVIALAQAADAEVWPLDVRAVLADASDEDVRWHQPPRDLRGEILALLGEGERLTCQETARAVQARTAAVLEILRSDPAIVAVSEPGRSPKEKVYALRRFDPPESPGTPPRAPTDADRLLAVLADGRAHSHLELYALGMIVHSRVSDLRKRGHHVRAWRESHPNGRRYWYQLAAPLAEREAVVPAVSPSASGSVLDEQGFSPGAPACHAGNDDGATGKGQAASIEPLQLTLGEAA